MPKLMNRIGLVGATVFCLSGPLVMVAGADGLIFTDDANFSKPAELGSGWYIRGELGYNFDGNHDVGSFGNPALATLYDNNYTDALNYSFYAGYRLSEFLRVEAGVGRLAGTDYRNTDLMVEDEFSIDVGNPLAVQPGEANPCNGWGEFIDIPTGTIFIGDDFITNCIQTDSAEYDVTFGMANAYFELGKYYGFTPFVGIGAGVGRVSWRQEIDAVDCTPRDEAVRVEGCRAYGVADQPAPNAPYTQPGTVSSGVDYRFGYTLAAGVGYAISDAATIEALYRYMDFGGASLSSSGTTGSMLADNGYATHQFNLGFRYAIW